MIKLRATSIALFLALGALALGACGDDKGSNESATTDATEATTGATDATTGTTEAGTTTRERTGKTNTQERKRDDKGGRGGGSDDSSGSGGGVKPGSPETQLTKKNLYSTAKTVCTDFLPLPLEKDLKEGKKSAEDIAKDYSQAYPADERKRAYDGCLAGLKTKG